MSVKGPSPSRQGARLSALQWAGALWLSVTALGQAAFVGFILVFYGVRTVSGNLAGWNDKPLIQGYVEGDDAGNFTFAVHVLLASVVTLCGLVQLAPAVRRRWPRLHRWSGRLFLTNAVVMALSGAWLVVVRGAYLSAASGAAILGNGLLILIFAIQAWRHAAGGRFERHRIWAMRAFMVVSGVWFLRVGLMGWVIVNQRPLGMTNDMSGPADVVLNFGSYLIPLAILELYALAQRRDDPALKAAMAAAVVGLSAFMGIGILGTITVMWGPYVLKS